VAAEHSPRFDSVQPLQLVEDKILERIVFHFLLLLVGFRHGVYNSCAGNPNLGKLGENGTVTAEAPRTQSKEFLPNKTSISRKSASPW
jgi:hypothetical protein